MATSKTFKQLARLAGTPPQRRGPFVPRTLARRDLDRWIPKLASMDSRQRTKLRGVSASRARQILAGAVLARTTMKTLNIPTVELSPWALREGIMLHYLEDALAESWSLPLQPVKPDPAHPPNVLDLPHRQESLEHDRG